MFRRLGVFGGLLISYILITLIPMSVFLGLILKNTQESFEDEIYIARLNTLVRIQDTIDLRVRECRSLTIQLSQNILTSEFKLTQTKYDSYMGILELQKYKAGNEFLLDVALFFKNSPYLYSSVGATTINLAFQEQYRLLDTEAQELADVLAKTKRVAAYSARSSNKLFLIVPMTSGVYITNRAVLFVFDDYSMSSLFVNAVSEPHEYRYLLDQNNQLLYVADHDNQEIAQQHLAIIAASNWKNESIIAYDHKTYQIASSESSLTGWQYVSILPMDSLRPIYQDQNLLISITIIVLCVCSILAAWFSSKYWQPVRKLGNQLAGDSLHQFNWETINAAASRIISQNRDFTSQLESHRMILRDNLILRMIHGNYDDTGELANEMRHLGFAEPILSFCAVSISSCQVQSRKSNEFVQFFLDKVASQFSDSMHLVETDRENYWLAGVIFLKSLDNQLAAIEVQQIIGRIDQEISSSDQFVYRIGIGRIVNATNNIKYSYMQSLIALNQSEGWVEESSTHIKFIDTKIKDPVLQPEMKEFGLYLVLAIKQGDLATAESMLQKIEKDIYNQHAVSMQFSCYKLIDVVSSYISSILIAMPDDLFDGETNFDALLGMVNLNEYDSFFSYFRQLVNKLCSHISQVNLAKDTQLASHIIAYVQNNFADSNFSLESVSSAFGSSIHYWSRFFKERIKQNFSDYVWQLRLDQAKLLLEQSERNLQEIVDEIGYIDARSFIRKFKSSEGITPNEYRKIHSKTRK